MNRNDVLDHALTQLTSGRPVTLTKDMQALVDQDPTLAHELAVTEAFWQTPESTHPQPSGQLRENFYQMLDEAKSEASASEAQSQVQVSFWEKLGDWLQMGPVAQFASLALVFVVGLQLGGGRVTSGEGDAIVALEKQVSSLSTVVALSMLEQSSASERLQGVTYSAQVPYLAPALLEQFVKVLQEDDSTAVRLAVIDRLGALDALGAIEAPLLDIVTHTDSPLVQIELIRLLLSKATPETQATLFQRLEASELDPDVNELIQQLRGMAQV